MLLDISRARSGETIASGRGAVVLGTLCAVPTALWLLDETFDDRFAGTYAALNGLAVLLAYTGTTAFGLNLVLGARLHVVDRLFGGLDRVYRAHRLTGEAAFTFLLAHVVLVVASRATVSREAAVDLLGPGAGLAVFAGVLAFSAMTVSMLLTVFARLGHEVFVYVQRSFGVVFLAGTYHALTVDSSEGSTVLRVYLVVVATAGIAAFAYRSVLGSVLVRRRPYRVVSVNRLDEHVIEIVMEPRGRPLSYEPGQFLFVNFRSLALVDELRPFELSAQRQILAIRPGEIATQFHPFSITSSPDESMLRITVKALGDYTSALRLLEPGAEAVVEGPFGSFSHRRVPSRRQAWAAGGIGVTPFLSMARSLAADDPTQVTFYYCVEREEEAHFLAELRAIESSRSGFRVVLVARDRHGLLTGARLALEHRDLPGTDVLVCGPPAMIESLRTQLEAEGLPRDRFHAEEFSFARLGGEGSPQTAHRPGGRMRSQRTSDARLIVALGMLALAALVFAAGLAIGGSIAADSPAPPVTESVDQDATGSGR